MKGAPTELPLIAQDPTIHLPPTHPPLWVNPCAMTSTTACRSPPGQESVRWRTGTLGQKPGELWMHKTGRSRGMVPMLTIAALFKCTLKTLSSCSPGHYKLIQPQVKQYNAQDRYSLGLFSLWMKHNPPGYSSPTWAASFFFESQGHHPHPGLDKMMLHEE